MSDLQNSRGITISSRHGGGLVARAELNKLSTTYKDMLWQVSLVNKDTASIISLSAQCSVYSPLLAAAEALAYRCKISILLQDFY